MTASRLAPLHIACFVLLACGFQPARCQGTIKITGLPQWKIQLVAATDPAAMSVVGPSHEALLIDSRLDQQPTPVLVVRNGSTKKIGAFKIRWDYQYRRAGKIVVRPRYWRFGNPDISAFSLQATVEVGAGAFCFILPSNNCIGPGGGIEHALAGLSSVPQPPFPVTQTPLAISLDSVLFVDGSVVGPDTGHLADQLELEQTTAHDAGVFMARARAAGDSDADLARDLSAEIRQAQPSASPLGTRRQIYSFEYVSHLRELAALLRVQRGPVVDRRANVMASAPILAIKRVTSPPDVDR